MRYTLLLVTIVALGLAACGGNNAKSSTSGYTDITTGQLQQMLKKKDFTLVNTHIPFAGNLPKTDKSIPYNEIGQRLNELPGNKDAKIVLYCRTGSMSTEAAQTLVRSGYTNVYELDGGMQAWSQAGLPLEGR